MRGLVLVRKCLRQFAQQERGVVAIIFAIAVVPIMLLIGSAVDYGSLTLNKQKVDMIADSAALAAISKNSLSDTSAVAQKRATDFFDGQKTILSNTVQISSFSLSVADSMGKRTATLNYTATQTPMFGAIYGQSSLSFSGTSTAQASFAPSIDFHLLLDNSPSMGVGATQKDIDKLMTNPQQKCAFACHVVAPFVYSAPNENNYPWAVQNKVTLRIDVLRSAVHALMDKVNVTRSSPDQIRLAIHTFGNECSSPFLNTLSGLSSDLTGLQTAATNLQLMTVSAYATVCTDFIKMFRGINTVISDPGDGSSPQKAQKVLFFVSDGVHDSAPVDSKLGCSGTQGAGRCHEPINLTLCKAIKDRGIKIAVLYTTYLPLPTDSWYQSMIAPFQPQITSRMQDCASPGLYYEVSPTQGISDAMNALFQKAVLQAKLTQ